MLIRLCWLVYLLGQLDYSGDSLDYSGDSLQYWIVMELLDASCSHQRACMIHLPHHKEMTWILTRWFIECDNPVMTVEGGQVRFLALIGFSGSGSASAMVTTLVKLVNHHLLFVSNNLHKVVWVNRCCLQTVWDWDMIFMINGALPAQMLYYTVPGSETMWAWSQRKVEKRSVLKHFVCRDGIFAWPV